MTYAEVLAEVLELLQRDKRVAYRVLKRRFALDDDYVEDLKADLIKAKRVAIDEDGEVLVWVGEPAATSVLNSSLPQSQSPRTYTPPHLAPFYYPQVSPSAAKSQPWVKSVNRFHPRHRRIVPGCPSFFLARNPPSRAIQRIASCRVGGWEGRVVVLCTVQ